MKKIVASVGLLAIGASGLQAAGASGLFAEESKPWSISAALRGFYDDNINAAPDDANLGRYSRESWGWEVSPSIHLALPMETGALVFNYIYSYKYYENELANQDGHDTQTHVFNLAWDHAFSERYQLSVKDAFALGQEPDILRAGNAMETYERIPGDNKRNYGSIDFNGAINQTLGYQIGYANTWMDYDDTGPSIGSGGQFQPSTAGLLNRIENAAHLDLRWTIHPESIGILGYQYRTVNYTADEAIAYNIQAPPPFVYSDLRNSRSHYGYVGFDHTFRPDLTGSIRLGAQYTDYYNDPTADNQVSPYILANLRYMYAQDCTLDFGLTTDRNATDIIGTSFQGYTVDQQSTVVYVALTHKITPKLFGTITGQYQYSSFNGGAYNNEAENYFMAGVNLEWRFDRHFAANIGYNFDDLNSDIPNRDMTRNRVYFGVTARY